MPNPLSRVRPDKVPLHIMAGGLAQRPELAKHVMSVIDWWSYSEAQLAALLPRFLKADYRVTHAMFQALSSAEARRSALTAAARATMSSEEFELYESVMRAIVPTRNTRNAFAHRLWCISESLPEALLLTDGSWEAEQSIIVKELVAKAMTDPQASVVPPETDYSRFMVYRENDLLREVEAAKRAFFLIYRFSKCLGDPSWQRDAWRAELSSELASAQTQGSPTPPG